MSVCSDSVAQRESYLLNVLFKGLFTLKGVPPRLNGSLGLSQLINQQSVRRKGAETLPYGERSRGDVCSE